MRARRIFVKGATYHITARINNSEFHLESADMKRLFLATVAHAHEKYKFELHNLCIMDNHIHFLIKPTGEKAEELARICQWIFSNFARRYNKIHRISGHIWYDRYKSTIVNEDRWARAFEYISQNPVRANMTTNPLLHEFNGLTLIRKMENNNQNWGIFEGTPDYLKDIIRALIRLYEDRLGNSKWDLIHESPEEISDPSYSLSFHTEHSLWCSLGDKILKEKRQQGPKFHNYMKRIAKTNLENSYIDDHDFWAILH
jgi:REP element-mobilizing transposase RayT